MRGRLRSIEWRLLRRAPGAIGLALLAFAVFFAVIAWQLQAAAARDLERAHELQGKEVPDEGSPPPSTAENRKVLAVLDRSIEIRTDIDGLLRVIERTVGDLQNNQERSRAIAVVGGDRVRAIAETLGGTLDATRSSLRNLSDLRGRLDRSVELARLIADELEELDRKLGPTVARNP